MSIIGDLLDFGSDLLTHSSNKRALNQIAGYATDTRDTNNALAEELYGSARNALSPYIAGGRAAYDALQREVVGGPDWDQYLRDNPDVAAHAERVAAAGGDRYEAARQHYEQYGRAEGRQLNTYQPSTGPEFGPREAYTRPDYGAAPTFTRADVAPLDLSIEAYRESPGYQFQLQRGMDALKSDRTMNGLLRSGAAVKSALDFSQGLADQDYQQWANRQIDLYYRDLGRSDSNFNLDRAYGTDLFLNNRNFADSNFETDRAYGTDLYNLDRDYATNRYDTRNSLLGGFADQGFSAVKSGLGAGDDFYSRTAGNNQGFAQTMADVSLGRAANRAGLYSSIPRTYANMESSFAQALAPGASGGTSSYLSMASNNFLNRQQPISFGSGLSPVRI